MAHTVDSGERLLMHGQIPFERIDRHRVCGRRRVRQHRLRLTNTVTQHHFKTTHFRQWHAFPQRDATRNTHNQHICAMSDGYSTSTRDEPSIGLIYPYPKFGPKPFFLLKKTDIFCRNSLYPYPKLVILAFFLSKIAEIRVLLGHFLVWNSKRSDLPPPSKSTGSSMSSTHTNVFKCSAVFCSMFSEIRPEIGGLPNKSVIYPYPKFGPKSLLLSANSKIGKTCSCFYARFGTFLVHFTQCFPGVKL